MLQHLLTLDPLPAELKGSKSVEMVRKREVQTLLKLPCATSVQPKQGPTFPQLQTVLRPAPAGGELKAAPPGGYQSSGCHRGLGTQSAQRDCLNSLGWGARTPTSIRLSGNQGGIALGSHEGLSGPGCRYFLEILGSRSRFALEWGSWKGPSLWVRMERKSHVGVRRPRLPRLKPGV